MSAHFYLRRYPIRAVVVVVVVVVILVKTFSDILIFGRLLK